MRILIANCHRAIVGGAERYLEALIPEMARRGHELGIIHTYPCSETALRIDPPHLALPAWQIEGSDTTLLRQDIQQWNPDVVFGHGLEPFSIERWLVETFPSVVFIHNYSHTCPTGYKCHRNPQVRACTRQAGPACLLLHYPLRCGGRHPMRMLRDYKLQSQRQKMLPRYGCVLVASQHMYKEVAAHSSSVRLKLANMPLTGAEPSSSPPERKAPGGKLLVTGRLTDVKGTEYVLRAMPLAAEKLGTQLHLTVAGTGPELANLQSARDQLRVDVDLRGWLDGAQVSKLMEQTDLLVVPSLWPEPFGLVGLEAGAVGTPAVGFALGGITDWLVPGRTGELAPGNPPTVAELADAIWRALRDPEHYNHLRHGAWMHARERSLQGHLEELDQVFETVAAGAQLPTGN